MKTYKNIGFGPRKGKGGFTLIELLIVMVILAILAGVVVMAVGGVFGSAHEAAYAAVHDDLQNATIAYATDNNGQFPTLNGTYNVTGPAPDTCTNCEVLNITALLTANGGMLRAIPDGLYDSNASGTDNCDGGGSAAGCEADSHYVWIIDTFGNLYSNCIGCSADNTNGFISDYWP